MTRENQKASPENNPVKSSAWSWVPNPFQLCWILTALTMLGGWFIGGSWSLVKEGWVNGFWGFLAFSMQIVLILVCGHTLAESTLVKKMLHYLAGLPKNGTQAAVATGLTSLISCWFNWGFGLIFTAAFVRALALRFNEKQIAYNYPLLGAAAYSGMMFQHGGLSGSAPLKVTTEGHFLQDLIGIIPVQDTIYSTPNLICSVVVLIVVSITLFWLGNSAVSRPGLVEDFPVEHREPFSWKESFLGIFGLLMLFTLDPGLSLNSMNFGLLFLGIAVYGSLQAYTTVFQRACSGASGIILQFPFYAGIMGIMNETGLIIWISDKFIELSDSLQALLGWDPFLLIVFVSGGIVNFFVPSGGGQWAVQGPIVMQAAVAKGFQSAPVVMALAYGDELTNGLQPFWALPLLAITGLKADEILPDSIKLFVVMGGVYFLTLLNWS